jgi:hypothetical protein
MKAKAPRQSRRLDAFISHASKELRFASRLVEMLENDGLKAWIDDAGVRFGALLRDELPSATAKF